MPPDFEPTYVKFFGEVNGQTTNALMQVIDQRIAQGCRKFVLMISTNGGSVFHGLSAHYFLCGIPAEIETHNFGSVDSIGVCLFVSGKKRFSVPDARFLIHPVTMTFQGTVSLEMEKLEEIIKGLRIDTKNIATTISRATGRTEQEIVQAISSRATMTPDEAKAFGLIHEIKKELFPLGANLVSINVA